jgi:GNAT superfamily N-acetyltransferase
MASMQSGPESPAAFRWIPIRSLAPRHRPRILAHLLELGEADRYLRFGYAISDSQVGRYVDGLDFERDEVFGVFDRRLAIAAMAHLAFQAEPGGREARAAEFGVSVRPRLRGRGVGARLFDHAMLHARNRGVDTLLVHALSENQAMLHIARRAGATVTRDGADSTARLRLPPDDFASQLESLAQDGAAAIDYRWKRGARRVHDLIEGIGEARAALAREGVERRSMPPE